MRCSALREVIAYYEVTHGNHAYRSQRCPRQTCPAVA